MWYVVVDRIHRIPGDAVGTIQSVHLTEEAAWAAVERAQRRVRRVSPQSYRMLAVYLTAKRPRGRYLRLRDIVRD